MFVYFKNIKCRKLQTHGGQGFHAFANEVLCSRYTFEL
jgi:hypothetical protein